MNWARIDFNYNMKVMYVLLRVVLKINIISYFLVSLFCIFGFLMRLYLKVYTIFCSICWPCLCLALFVLMINLFHFLHCILLVKWRGCSIVLGHKNVVTKIRIFSIIYHILRVTKEFVPSTSFLYHKPPHYYSPNYDYLSTWDEQLPGRVAQTVPPFIKT